MRLEIRASQGGECAHCGATPLIVQAGNEAPIVKELGELVEVAAREREEALLEDIAEARANMEEDMRERLIPALAKGHLEYEQQVRDIVGAKVPRWRFVKRRWQEGLAFSLAAAEAQLKDETRHA